MYKPRNKYFDVFNSRNIVNRIMESKYFSPYEFMSLRYACCELIARLDLRLEKGYEGPISRKNMKNKKKLLQSCINKLDMYYEREVN